MGIQPEVLVNLMYHRVGRGKYANTPKMMENHLAYLAKKRTVLPGEKLVRGINLCLTFDDATIDFYEFVFPRLKEHNLKAVLAVPTGKIGEEGYCTWEMLEEMSRSDRVAIACHSHTHPNMTQKGDLAIELDHAKELLESRLRRKVDTFVYPYGKWNRKLQREVKKRFTYGMRIGSGAQKKWKGLMCRIPADRMPEYRFPFTFNVLIKATAKGLLNALLRK